MATFKNASTYSTIVLQISTLKPSIMGKFENSGLKLKKIFNLNLERKNLKFYEFFTTF